MRTVLLIEDNEANRRLAGFLLRSQGYRVCEAATAEAALESARLQRPDLILMDLQLPGADGLELTRVFKRQAATADIPIVAVTSYAMNGDRERALAAGCAGYIAKPIDKNTFIHEVASHLRRDCGVGQRGKQEDEGEPGRS